MMEKAPSQIRPAFKPKVLIYSQSQLLVDAGAIVHNRFDCMPIQLRDSKQILPHVYDNMPVMIIAEAESVDDPALDILKKIKQDPVLEHIPLILAAPKRLDHSVFALATVVLPGNFSMNQLSFNIASIMVEVEHQLDMNPFSTMPGHHTSLRELENAIALGGDVSAVTIRIRNLELFGATRSALSADVLADQVVRLIRECAQSTFSRKWLIGHLGWPTFVTLFSDDKAQEFKAKLTAEFDRTYDEMVLHSTQSQFTTGLDSLRGKYVGTDRVKLSIVVLPLKTGEFKSADDLVRVSTERHNRLAAEEHEAATGEGSASRVKKASDYVEHFLSQGTIETYFQPIVDCWEKSVFAYEALTRFLMPNGSFLHPEVMFGSARESGLIEKLDLRCLDAAMAAFSKLKTSAKVFLNVDRATFAQLDNHLDLFDRHGIPHAQLVLELTEQSLMGQRRKLIQVKKTLLENGILVAFDDAGTGDVSFREVGEFKPAYIKFERKLITGITRSPLKQRHVLSMRAFARGIGAMTIAEGVEMPSELEYVKGIRLNFAQGYYIARPMKDPAP